MIRSLTTSLLAFGLAATPALAEPHTYELDPEHTTVAFLADHVGFASVLGRFASVSGTFTYDMETQELSDVEVRVDTAEVMTFDEARDEHVRSDDFLSAADHPVMTFTADRGKPAGEDTGTVEGTLTLRGESNPLTLDVTLNKAAEYPFGHKRFTLGLTIRGTVKRSEYGMTYAVKSGLVGDDVDVLIETEALRME